MAARPVRPRLYVDREEDVHRIREEVQHCRDLGHTALIHLHGLAGIGTSALATKIHDDDPDFFGTLIWVPMRQPDGQLMSLEDVAHYLLTQLGVPPEDHETTQSALIASLDRVLRRGGRRTLVLDGVDGDFPFAQLVVNDVPGLTIVATAARRTESAMRAEFVAFPVGELADDARLILLAAKLRRTPLSDDVLNGLAKVTGNPHLISVIAGQLSGRGHLAEDLLADLRESPARLLALDDERRVADYLDLVTKLLPRELRAAYAVSSLIPGLDFGPELAAVALETDLRSARRTLESLAEVDLVHRAGDRPRYLLHSVTRADARARADELGVDSVAVVRRACTALLAEAAAHDAMLGGRWRVGPVFETPHRPVTRQEALAWFEREWLNVADAARAAHRAGLPELAYQLVVALHRYLHLNRLTGVWITVHEDGLQAAQALPDGSRYRQLAIAQLANQRAAGQLAVDNLTAARDDLHVSLEAARAAQLQLAADDALMSHAVMAEQSALEWLGKVAAAQGDPVAREFYQQSLDALRHPVDPFQRERATATVGLQKARYSIQVKEWDRALAEVEPVFGWFDGDDTELDNQAKCLEVTATALLGKGAPALAEAERSAELFGRDAKGRTYALALLLVADAAAALNLREREVAARREALPILQRIGSPLAEDVRERLVQIDGDDGAQPPVADA